uniref:Protein kinase domain-containing protein n=1 Tax=Chlamydomonas leiostraca TaxID=1034604 RepID=A0A7S0WL53_9CHLO
MPSSTRAQAVEDLKEYTVCKQSFVVPVQELLGDLKLTAQLGAGGFSTVYQGLWRNTTSCAVKVFATPVPNAAELGGLDLSNSSGAITTDGRGSSAPLHANLLEALPLQVAAETLLSKDLSHPNVVQTYTYAVRPVMGDKTTAGEEGPGASITMSETHEFLETKEGGVTSWEVRLVIEFCDKGSLRDALNRGVFVTAESRVNMVWVVETALDVARAMLHLHCNNVLHADLKARNVMLSSAGNEGRGLRCKVADFGLAVRMEHTETHMSGMFQGTLTHMAPEILLEGRMSKAADMYAFGITLWELYTSQRPFHGMPKALLGHQITREHRRPAFPANTPADYKDLAERCWAPAPGQRPGFKEVLDALLAMREAHKGITPALSAYALGPESGLEVVESAGAQVPGNTRAGSSADAGSVTLEGSTLASMVNPAYETMTEEDYLGQTVVAAYSAHPAMPAIGEHTEMGEEEEEEEEQAPAKK